MSATHMRVELSGAEIAMYYAHRAPDVKQTGGEWRGPCPVHHGTDDNFSVESASGLWCCHSQCGRGGSVFDLEMAVCDVDFRTALDRVGLIVGRPDLRNGAGSKGGQWGLPAWSVDFLWERIAETERKNGWKHTAIYPYFRPDGAVSYVKVRFVDKQNDKTFRQWAITKPLGWATRKKAKAEPLLYRANTLAAADEIFIVNGEKAADRGAADLGITTTCAPDGEGKWSAEFTETFCGKLVRIVMDNDQKGRDHGRVVGTALAGLRSRCCAAHRPALGTTRESIRRSEPISVVTQSAFR